MPTSLATRKSLPWLPRWVLRLVGYSSLAAAILSLAMFLFRRFPPGHRRRLCNNQRKTIPSSSETGIPPTSSLSSTTASWSSRIFDSVRAGTQRSKKRMTISLKNTVLWNPSSDVDTPNHAFQENGASLLSCLAKTYDVYVMIHVYSDDDKNQIQTLLSNAGLVGSTGLDSRKILYCSSEEGKIHMVRHIEPHIHVEGGWEKDDGEDIVRKLRPFVPKLLWVITKRRRSSFNQAKLKECDQDVMGNNVELTEQLLDTSLAREMGFSVDCESHQH